MEKGSSFYLFIIFVFFSPAINCFNWGCDMWVMWRYEAPACISPLVHGDEYIYIHRHMNLIILMFWVITCSKRTPTHVPSPTNSGVRDQLLLHIRPSPGLWHFFLLMWVGLSLGLCLSISFTPFSTHWFVRFSKNKHEMGITSMQQWVRLVQGTRECFFLLVVFYYFCY